MDLGGQGQRPCEADRYLRNMNVRLCDRPIRREESDVVRISARQLLLRKVTYKYSECMTVQRCTTLQSAEADLLHPCVMVQTHSPPQ